MILGVVIGATWVFSLILAYMAGYGMADQKHNKDEE